MHKHGLMAWDVPSFTGLHKGGGLRLTPDFPPGHKNFEGSMDSETSHGEHERADGIRSPGEAKWKPSAWAVGCFCRQNRAGLWLSWMTKHIRC